MVLIHLKKYFNGKCTEETSSLSKPKGSDIGIPNIVYAQSDPLLGRSCDNWIIKKTIKPIKHMINKTFNFTIRKTYKPRIIIRYFKICIPITQWYKKQKKLLQRLSLKIEVFVFWVSFSFTSY